MPRRGHVGEPINPFGALLVALFFMVYIYFILFAVFCVAWVMAHFAMWIGSLVN